MFMMASLHPTELLFKRGDGEEFRMKQVLVRRIVTSLIVDKTMNQMTGKVVDNPFVCTQQHQRFLEEQQRFFPLSVDLVVKDRGAGEHCSDIEVKPLLLGLRQRVLGNIVKEGVKTCICAGLLCCHGSMNRSLLFEPDEVHDRGCPFSFFRYSGQDRVFCRFQSIFAKMLWRIGLK